MEPKYTAKSNTKMNGWVNPIMETIFQMEPTFMKLSLIMEMLPKPVGFINCLIISRIYIVVI